MRRYPKTNPPVTGRMGGAGVSSAAPVDPAIFIVEGGQDIGYYTGLTGIEHASELPSVSGADISGGLNSFPTLPQGLGYGRNVNTGAREYIVHSAENSPFTMDIPAGTTIYAPEKITIALDDGGNLKARVPILLG